MENLIASAIRICDHAKDQKGKTIPNNLLEICSGVAFLHTTEVSAIAMAHAGNGLIIRRDVETKKWSPPCALSDGGAGAGFAIGISSTDYILIFVDDGAIRHLTHKKDVTLGSDFGIKAGPIQGKDHAQLDSAGMVYSYAFNKGVFAGIGMEGGVIRVKEKKNKDYYKTDAPAEDILFKQDAVNIPADSKIYALYEKLNSIVEESSE